MMSSTEAERLQHQQQLISEFTNAAATGRLDVMHRLVETAPEHLQDMIVAKGALNIGGGRRYDYAPFAWAAQNGHLDVLRYLEEIAPDQMQRMIATCSFYAYNRAACCGQLDVLRYLEEKAGDQLQDMLAANNFYALQLAGDRGQTQTVNHLLHHTSVFAFSESHVEEWHYYTTPFIQEQLGQLRIQKERFDLENPREVFTPSPEEARFYFYVLRNLIRRASFDPVRNDFVFLMNMPSVRDLLHTQGTTGQDNELLRLALSTNNRDAAVMLLDIPAVRALAEANDFYRQEQQGGIDLRQLAQDRESSMRALTQGEQARLAELEGCYSLLLDATTVEEVMADLRETLAARYEANPATISIQDPITNDVTVFELPLSWEKFEQLQLNAEDKARALKAYYEHPDHTALRYLSKPNHWMHPEASYVEINEARTERWAVFAGHEHFMALLYLAANDETELNGYNRAQRLELFIKDIALIGRAHNWDRTRDREDAQRRRLLVEEFDDGQGDRPSCFSGVKRRLFHSLVTFLQRAQLTQEHIEQELNSFMRQHFKNRITKDNRMLVQSAWGKLIAAEELSTEEHHALKQLNVTQEEQNSFISELTQKYGQDFTSDLGFTCFIQSRLLGELHLAVFGYLDIERLLQESDEGLQQQHRFFAPVRAQDNPTDTSTFAAHPAP
jgi:hypothetical protein